MKKCNLLLCLILICSSFCYAENVGTGMNLLVTETKNNSDFSIEELRSDNQDMKEKSILKNSDDFTRNAEKENKKPFFYYIANEHFKTNVSLGYNLNVIELKALGTKHKQKAIDLDWNLIWLPWSMKSCFLIGGADFKVPLQFESRYGDITIKEKNFENGFYITVSPFIGAGFSFSFKKKKVPDILLSLGLSFDSIRGITQGGEWTKLNSINVFCGFNFKYRLNQRYSFLFQLKGSAILKSWSKEDTFKSSGDGMVVSFGISYDF